MNTSPIEIFRKFYKGVCSSPKNNDIYPIYDRRHLSAMTEKQTIYDGEYSKKTISLYFVLNHPIVGNLFREYSRSLFSDENINFIDCITNGQEDNKYIMENYIIENSKYTINLKYSTKISIIQKYNINNKTKTLILFREAISEVFEDIKNSDIFRNFINSNEDIKNYVNQTDRILIKNWLNLGNYIKLIQNISPEISNIVKFLISMNTLEKIDKINKKTIKTSSNKIFSTYIQSGSKYHISINIPEYLNDIIYSDKVESLQTIAELCIDELIKNEEFMKNLRKIV